MKRKIKPTYTFKQLQQITAIHGELLRSKCAKRYVHLPSTTNQKSIYKHGLALKHLRSTPIIATEPFRPDFLFIFSGNTQQ